MSKWWSYKANDEVSTEDQFCNPEIIQCLDIIENIAISTLLTMATENILGCFLTPQLQKKLSKKLSWWKISVKPWDGWVRYKQKFWKAAQFQNLEKYENPYECRGLSTSHCFLCFSWVNQENMP